jgi:hypothetical protein
MILLRFSRINLGHEALLLELEQWGLKRVWFDGIDYFGFYNISS